MARRTVCCFVGVVWLACVQASGATYYVDYAGGDDKNAGTSPDKAFRHSPEDQQAKDVAAGVRLQPGDVVRFKGGVVYRGQIDVKRPGAAGNPIVFDGTGSGGFGAGRAVIDGSAPIDDLKPCDSAAEAGGNPNYKSIFCGHLPKGSFWNTIALCQGDDLLPVSQDPDLPDPVFQEDPRYYVKTDPDIPQTTASIQVRFLGGLSETKGRPLVSMFDESGTSAVISRINSGGEVEIETPEPVTVVEFSMTPQPRYTNPKEVGFFVGGKEVLKATLKASGDKLVEQKFPLEAPVTFQKLVVKFYSAHPNAEGKTPDWGAVRRLAAYDKAGKNVLRATRKSTLVNKPYFTQKDPNYWEGAYVALFAQPAQVYYKRILQYDPAEHRITFETLSHAEVPYERGGAFSITNSVRLINRPGEYAVSPDPEKDGTHKVYVWPLRLTDGKPEGLTYGRYGNGFNLAGASYVTIQGFIIKKQGGAGGSSGINARGPATDLVLRDVTVTGLRGQGAGISTVQVDNVLIDHCEVSENAGHTRGIMLRIARNAITRHCVLRRNSSTALDYYTIHNGVVRDCAVFDNKGMHANGLTFYVGCTDILVEDNYVAGGNSGLTVQDGNNMVIRNNIFAGAPAVALWSGQPFDNIVMTNNWFIYDGEPGGSTAAIYGGNLGARGYTIVNNIIDGLSGNVLRKAEVHHNIFTRIGPVQREGRLGDNQYVPDLRRLFVDPNKADGRPREGSPAIDAGVTLAGLNKRDRDGVRRDLYGKADIGPYEYTGSSLSTAGKYPRDFAESHVAFAGLKAEVEAAVKAARLPDAIAGIEKVLDLSPNSRFAEDSLRKIFVDLTNDQQQGVYAFFQGRVAQYEKTDALKAEEYAAMYARFDSHIRDFTRDGYKIQPVAETAPKGYESVFEALTGGQAYAIKALDFTGEGGGKVKTKTQFGSIYNWNDKDHWLEWTVADAKEGSYELVVEYGSETPSVRRYVLNGEPVKGLEKVALGATGGWQIWEKAALATAIRLTAGRNVLRVVNVEGPLNFRSLRFVPVASDKPTKPHFVSDVPGPDKR